MSFMEGSLSHIGVYADEMTQMGAGHAKKTSHMIWGWCFKADFLAVGKLQTEFSVISSI